MTFDSYSEGDRPHYLYEAEAFLGIQQQRPSWEYNSRLGLLNSAPFIKPEDMLPF
jgi:hypothetical protein